MSPFRNCVAFIVDLELNAQTSWGCRKDWLMHHCYSLNLQANANCIPSGVWGKTFYQSRQILEWMTAVFLIFWCGSDYSLIPEWRRRRRLTVWGDICPPQQTLWTHHSGCSVIRYSKENQRSSLTGNISPWWVHSFIPSFSVRQHIFPPSIIAYIWGEHGLDSAKVGIVL